MKKGLYAGVVLILSVFTVNQEAYGQSNLNDLNWPSFDGVYVLTNDDEFIELRPIDYGRVFTIDRPNFAGPWDPSPDHYYEFDMSDISVRIDGADFRGIVFVGIRYHTALDSNLAYMGYTNAAVVTSNGIDYATYRVPVDGNVRANYRIADFDDISYLELRSDVQTDVFMWTDRYGSGVYAFLTMVR